MTADFSRKEFACKCGNCTEDHINLDLVERLQRLRNITTTPLIINSGVRCAAHNLAVGGVPNSAHVTGDAADIGIAVPEQMFKLVKYIMFYSLFDRIGIGEKKGLLHVDVSKILPHPRIWTY